MDSPLPSGEDEGSLGAGFIADLQESGLMCMANFGASRSLASLENLAPLMRAKGVTMSPAEFQRSVNLVFHAFEAGCYDRIHRDMRQSLPRQFDLLTSDYLRRYLPAQGMAALDIGCGTGLSAEMLVGTRLRPYIESLDLLDTSQEMLDACGRRRGLRYLRRRLLRGTIDDLPLRPGYDLVLTCSVLHHIPDLAAFTRAIAMRQTPGSIFLHLQDPNADSYSQPECEKRLQEWRNSTEARVRAFAKHLNVLDLASRAVGKLIGRPRRTYIDRVNDELFRTGVIRERMTPQELWSVTDLQEHHGQGICISMMSLLLPEYDLVSRRSYGFFGELESRLSRRFRTVERELISHKAPDGTRIGAIWVRKESLTVS